MLSKRKLLKRIGTAIVGPVLFLVIGYGMIYMIGKPVIQFVTSSLELFMLSEVPEMKDKTVAFAQKEAPKAPTQTATDELASSKITYPRGGERYGTVQIPVVKLNVPLYYGDTEEILRHGAGQYFGSVYPGEKGTTLIAAHNLDMFGSMVNNVTVGDEVVIETTYGKYTYQIDKTSVKHKDDPEIETLLNQRETYKVALYTCYFDTLFELTPERFFVEATLVSGPKIDSTK